MIEKIDFAKLGGLVPTIVQDSRTKRVLMLGFMNREALDETLRLRRVVFWSRARQQLWVKGETSGNALDLVSVEPDCDGDALLVLARSRGPVCHTGNPTCFKNNLSSDADSVFRHLEQIIEARKQAAAEQSYTARLFEGGIEQIAQKVGEEAVEVVIAALKDNSSSIREESADLLYHLLVLLRECNITLAEVADVLSSRMKQ